MSVTYSAAAAAVAACGVIQVLCLFDRAGEINHEVGDAWPLRRQTSGYVPDCRVELSSYIYCMFDDKMIEVHVRQRLAQDRSRQRTG